MNEFALSGSAIAVTAANNGPGNAVPVINWTAQPMGCLDPTKSNRRHGMCSIHIDEWDEQPFFEEAREIQFPNQYLVADVTYATEGRGGEFTVGLTRGTVLAVGGVDVISIKAYFVPAVLGQALNIFRTKRVQATITWPTSINPKEAKISLPSISLEADSVLSAWFPIPRQAESMMVLSTVPASFPTLEAHFANSNIGGGPDAYVTLDPNANGTPIERGVEFVRFASPVAMVITPVFSIWP